MDKNHAFTFRMAGLDDRFLIHDLAVRIWPQTYANLLSEDQIAYMLDMMYSVDNIATQIQEHGHQYFIVMDGSLPVGYISFEVKDERTYCLQKIYTLPELHGTGVGRFAFQEGLAYLKSTHEGSFCVELYVNRENPAVGFYHHMGLREIGRRDHHIGNGYYMNDYIMVIDVDN